MRQLILATSFIMGDASTPVPVEGATLKGVGFAYDNAGVPTYAESAAKLKDYFNIVFKKDADLGDVVYPAYKKNFTYSIAKFAAMASAATGTGDISSFIFTPGRDVTVVVVKKGVKFNERNRWSYVHRVTDDDDATSVGNAIAAYINANPECGVTAVNTAGSIAFTAIAKDGAAVIKFTDDFHGIADVVLEPARVDSSDATINLIPSIKEYLEDLLSKAAADAGFRDTRQDNKLYPGLTGTSGIDVTPYTSGFTVYTLRFQEPRIVKQALNEDVTQIVQIVLPTADYSATLDAILAAIGSQIN